VKFEQCNNLDDDCDTLIDEDFPNKGRACDNGMLGRCRGTGTYVCTATGAGTTCNITNPGATPTVEICNNIDDNCDGQIDEGLICSCSGVEICNNARRRLRRADRRGPGARLRHRRRRVLGRHPDLRRRQLGHLHRHRPHRRDLQQPRRRLRRRHRRPGPRLLGDPRRQPQ
jgi:hypothetical protein